MQNSKTGAECASADAKDKQDPGVKTPAVEPEPRKVFVVKSGSQNIAERCYAMAQVLCSMSGEQNGCGAVFWAEIGEFRRDGIYTITSLSGKKELIEGGWIIECPECKRQTGGIDVQFKMISASSFLRRFGFDLDLNRTNYFLGPPAAAPPAVPRVETDATTLKESV